MKKEKYRFLIVIIVLMILVTVSMQVYWNAKNIENNRQRIAIDAQIALDNALELYFKNVSINEKKSLRRYLKPTDTLSNHKNTITLLKHTSVDSASDFTIHKNGKNNHTVIKIISQHSTTSASQKKSNQKMNSQDSTFIVNLDKNRHGTTYQYFSKKTAPTVDSVYLVNKKRLENFANKIIFSLIADSLNLKKIATFAKKELKRKNIEMDFGLEHFRNDKSVGTFPVQKSTKRTTTVLSKSVLIPTNEKIELSFTDPTVLLLKKSLFGLILSLVLTFLIVGCLFYFLHIINKQKKIDDIKNDLISNITHEFKTPITTIGTAIESIRHFNNSNDLEKTNRYLDISQQQLDKLHQMVEKFLETATLDHNDLSFNLENTDIVQVIQALVLQHKVNSANKKIIFETDLFKKMIKIDVFHFENAISNLVDNAIKYGGNSIQVQLKKVENTLQINVIDNGNGINKSYHELVFEKFFRIPQGNIHAVKGFGIGLFYTKKTIEKHGFSIKLLSTAGFTNFIITIPNVQ